MKKKSLFCILIICILVSGFSFQKADEDASIVLWDKIRIPVPEGWLVKGTQMETAMYFGKEPVLLIKRSSFDEETVKEKYSVHSIEECIIHYCPGGVLLNEAAEKEIGSLIVYEIHGTGVEKYSKEHHAFIESEDEIYLDFIVQKENKEIYCFYFMNSMADSKKIEEYMGNISWYEDTNNNDGRYRWLMQPY